MARIPDLVVAGGGPAGLATAIAARQQGLEVTVIDPRLPPIDRACGEGLMPNGWSCLERLGVVLPTESRFPFEGVRYVAGKTCAEGLFSHGPGYGVRRTELHNALTARARSLGAELRWGVRGTGAQRDGLHTDAGLVPGRYVVLADGRGSRIRARCGLDGAQAGRRRIGLRQHFRITPWSRRVEVHWADGCEAYVTPVAHDEVGVAILTGALEKKRFPALLRRFPALAERLATAGQSSQICGAGPFSSQARRVAKGRLALVGDASLCLDPLTGEGLSMAFRQALAVAEAIASDNLDSYVVAHRRMVTGVRRTTALVLLLTRSPRLRDITLRALAADSKLFSRFLDTMDRGRSPSPRDLVLILLSGLLGTFR